MINAYQRLRLIVGRAKINRVNDKPKLQRLQVSALADEVRDDVPRMQNFGHTGNPMPGCQVIVVSVGGSRDAMVAIAVDDPATRPTDLQPGETATYNAHGVKFTYNKDRDAILECRRLIVYADQKILFDTPLAEFTGDVLIQGNTIINLMLTVKGLFTYLAGMAGFGGKGGKSTIQGDIEHTGGKLSSNGVVADTHTHPDPHGGNTLEPNK